MNLEWGGKLWKWFLTPGIIAELEELSENSCRPSKTCSISPILPSAKALGYFHDAPPGRSRSTAFHCDHPELFPGPALEGLCQAKACSWSRRVAKKDQNPSSIEPKNECHKAALATEGSNEKPGASR